MQFGTVTGRILATIADRVTDPDVNPDVVPVGGKVVFTPSVSAAISSSEGAIVLPTPIEAVLDSEGYLSLNGQRGVSLVATDSPDLNPTGFTYTVTFADLQFDKFKLAYKPFSIAVPAGQTVDLSTLTPVGSSNGAIIIRGEKGDAGAQGPAGDPATNLVTSVAGRQGIVTLSKSDVGLGNVDNTADAAKPVSTAQQAALDAKSGLTSTNAFTGRNSFGPDGTTAYYGLSSGYRMQYNSASDKLKIAHYQQSQILGDWSADTSLNPGILFGRNSFTVVGKNSGDGVGVKGVYGELIEVDVQSPNANIPFIVGLQSEAAFANAAAGAVVGSLTSHKVAAPSRKDGATGGTADRVYGLYIETVAAGVLGSTRAFSLYVQGGYSVFDTGTLIGKNIIAADPAVNGYNTSPGSARLWVQGSSATNNVMVVQNFPTGGATVDPIKLVDADGVTQLFGVTATGSIRLRGAVLQTTVGAAGTAAALPSAPKKYWRVTDSDGSIVLVPVYSS